MIEALSDESVEPSYPGLDGLALRLTAVNEKKNESLLRHKDNEVRLYILMACFKTFAIYAPEPPFSPEAAFEIFTQLIAQLANLSHTTLDTQPNYHNYFSILEHLPQVRTGIVLVECCQGHSGAITPSHGDQEDDEEEIAAFQRQRNKNFTQKKNLSYAAPKATTSTGYKGYSSSYKNIAGPGNNNGRNGKYCFYCKLQNHTLHSLARVHGSKINSKIQPTMALVQLPPVHLYRSMLRVSKQVNDYNFRSYAIRRVKTGWRLNRNLIG